MSLRQHVSFNVTTDLLAALGGDEDLHVGLDAQVDRVELLPAAAAAAEPVVHGRRDAGQSRGELQAVHGVPRQSGGTADAAGINVSIALKKFLTIGDIEVRHPTCGPSAAHGRSTWAVQFHVECHVQQIAPPGMTATSQVLRQLPLSKSADGS